MKPKEKKEHIDELRWVRVFTPIHIPKVLVEQVRDKDFTVEDFYKYQEMVCLQNGNEGPVLNPLNHLYVLVNDENLTKGFVWFIVDPLTKDLVINTVSVDKEYWNNGKAIKKGLEFIKGIRDKAKLNKIYWITNHPKHAERYGCVKSKSILMEYKEEKNGKNNKRISGGSGSSHSE